MLKKMIKKTWLYIVLLAAVILSISHGRIIAEAVSTPTSFLYKLSNKPVASTGRLVLNERENSSSVLTDIDADDIKKNRQDIEKLGGQLGWSENDTKVFFYEVGNELWVVTGTHTIISGMDENKARAIIKAEKSGSSSVTYQGKSISLTSGGNSTWQRMYGAD